MRRVMLALTSLCAVGLTACATESATSRRILSIKVSADALRCSARRQDSACSDLPRFLVQTLNEPFTTGILLAYERGHRPDDALTALVKIVRNAGYKEVTVIGFPLVPK